MKKVLSIAAATAMLAIVACGPSADEKAKAEAAKLDSIEQQRIADSSTLQAQEMAMTADTTAAPADSTAAPAAEAPAAH